MSMLDALIVQRTAHAVILLSIIDTLRDKGVLDDLEDLYSTAGMLVEAARNERSFGMIADDVRTFLDACAELST